MCHVDFSDSDRRHQEAAEQRFRRSDQQDAACPAEHGDLTEGGLSAADVGSCPHSGSGLQKPAGCSGPSSRAGQPGKAQTHLACCRLWGVRRNSAFIHSLSKWEWIKWWMLSIYGGKCHWLCPTVTRPPLLYRFLHICRVISWKTRYHMKRRKHRKRHIIVTS